MDDEVYVRPPCNLRRDGVIWRLKKALYRLRQAPRLFSEFFGKTLQHRGLRRCVIDPQFYYDEATGLLLSGHADDIMLTGPTEAIDKLKAGLAEYLEDQVDGNLTAGRRRRLGQVLGQAVEENTDRNAVENLTILYGP
eukprot:10033452-Heterocapsa_arctica.AAC.1